jgi:hypothetical protein
LAVYALVVVVAAWQADNLYAIPFMLLYVGGFGLTAGLGIWQAWRGRRWRAKAPGMRRRALPARGRDHAVEAD